MALYVASVWVVWFIFCQCLVVVLVASVKKYSLETILCYLYHVITRSVYSPNEYVLQLFMMVSCTYLEVTTAFLTNTSTIFSDLILVRILVDGFVRIVRKLTSCK